MALTNRSVNSIKKSKSRRIIVRRRIKKITKSKRSKNTPNNRRIKTKNLKMTNNNSPIETNPFQLGDGPNGSNSAFQNFANINSSNVEADIDRLTSRHSRSKNKKRRFGSKRRSVNRRPSTKRARSAMKKRRK